VAPPLGGARGALNMAIDHALLESVQRGGAPVLRLYRWDPPCLSLGRNQHARGIYDETRLRDTGIEVVRRPTGGLAVLHDRELTYCVLVPAPLLGGPRATYRAINEALVAGLRALGVPARLAGSGAGPDPRLDATRPCFQAPAEGEVVAAGRKLVGSAQRCEAGTLLQHGSILLDGSQSRVLQLLARPADGGPQAITLRELLGATPDVTELVAAFVAGFEAMCGIRLAPGSLTRQERARLPGLAARYEDATWTWRR
jgi:lipoyl(octanoyl) transferase